MVVRTAPTLFIFCVLQIGLHLGLILGAGKVMGFSRRDVLVASNANVGGTSSSILPRPRQPEGPSPSCRLHTCVFCYLSRNTCHVTSPLALNARDNLAKGGGDLATFLVEEDQRMQK